MRSATAWIRSTLPTDVPPNFWTTMDMRAPRSADRDAIECRPEGASGSDMGDTPAARGETKGTNRHVGRILVVDDDPLNRRLLEKRLRQDDHEVTTASDGKECLEALDGSTTDVVLLDILMPGMDGFEVLERIKSDPELRHVPVIMISGLEDIQGVVRCIEMGADDFLPKPFDPVILRARVNAGLDRSRLHALEREYVRSVFARFLPEAVVDDALARSEGGTRLGGERITGTVMFVDLRSFTAFAEATAAERVVETLNTYLGAMGDAVLDHGGTLVSYLGDGLLAAFGAPIPAEDHADRAVAASREMIRERLPSFNDWVRSQGIGDGFGLGVGVNSGPVMAGNVGSERRLEYTVVGDTVNVASRIEGLTKQGSYPVLVADTTRDAMRAPPDDLVFVDDFEIRGRASTIGLWGLAP
jgi:class 3 adenylate cyclase